MKPRLSQRLNASDSITATDAGMVIFASLLALKHFVESVVVPAGRFTLVREEVPSKQFAGITVTADDDISTDCKFWQLVNAELSTVFTFAGL